MIRALCFILTFSLAAVQSGGMVYIADDGAIYHRIGCPLLKGTKKIVGYKREQLPPQSKPCSVCLSDEQPSEAQPLEPIVIGPQSVPVAPKWTQGPQLLNAATYAEAIQCGQESPWWRACAEENLDMCGTASIRVSLRTPFVEVMSDVDGDAKQLRQPSPRSISMANRTPATIMVFPGSNLSTMNSPTRVVAEKDGARVNPLRSLLTPTVLQNAFGVTRSAANGAFTFPMELFAPTSPTTLLIAVESGQPIRCELPVEKLRQLR